MLRFSLSGSRLARWQATLNSPGAMYSSATAMQDSLWASVQERLEYRFRALNSEPLNREPD
jgi:hypothetical protein